MLSNCSGFLYSYELLAQRMVSNTVKGWDLLSHRRNTELEMVEATRTVRLNENGKVAKRWNTHERVFERRYLNSKFKISLGLTGKKGVIFWKSFLFENFGVPALNFTPALSAQFSCATLSRHFLSRVLKLLTVRLGTLSLNYSSCNRCWKGGINWWVAKNVLQSLKKRRMCSDRREENRTKTNRCYNENKPCLWKRLPWWESAKEDKRSYKLQCGEVNSADAVNSCR